MQSRLLTVLSEAFTLIPSLTAVFVIHGFTAAVTAWFLGDRRREVLDRISLNPAVHVDPVGLVVISFMIPALHVIFGSVTPGVPSFLASLVWVMMILSVQWFRPVRVNAAAFRGAPLTAILYAPLRFLLDATAAFLVLLLMMKLPEGRVPAYVMKTLALLSDLIVTMLMIFSAMSLMPIPPFEAGRVLHTVATGAMASMFDFLEEYSAVVIAILLLVPFIGDVFFGFVRDVALGMRGLIYALASMAAAASLPTA